MPISDTKNNLRKSHRSSRKLVCYDESVDEGSTLRKKDNGEEKSERENINVKRNISDAWESMVQNCQVDVKKKSNCKDTMSLNKNVKVESRSLGGFSHLPKTLIIKKLDEHGATIVKNVNVVSNTESNINTVKKSQVLKSVPEVKISGSDNTTKHAIDSPNPSTNTIRIHKSTSIRNYHGPAPKPGVKIFGIENTKNSPASPKPESKDVAVNDTVSSSSVQDAISSPKITLNLVRKSSVGNWTTVKATHNEKEPNKAPKQSSEIITKKTIETTTKRKEPLKVPNDGSGHVNKKNKYVQKKAIVKTIKKLNINVDHKKRIEDRLNQIGSNLHKIKAQEIPKTNCEENMAQHMVEKKSLIEILSEPVWLEMFLKTEPTARYDTDTKRIFCLTCRYVGEDDDGWVSGHFLGKSWLMYPEHKTSSSHQTSSTKYYLQLFNACKV